MRTTQFDRRAFLAFSAAVLAAPASASGGGGHAFRFEALGARGGEIALGDHAGRPVLVVNTASRCGFTYQYDAIQRLWARSRDDGLLVVGTPSRDFGRQEFADEDRIRDFCEANFAIDFPMSEIVRVKGPQAHPFYVWARREAEALDMPTPRWNFHKYLVGADGRLAGSWTSSTEPDAPEILETVRRETARARAAAAPAHAAPP